MGFRVDAYAKVWEVEDKGNYSEVSLSVSQKDKKTGEYNTTFSDRRVRFIGPAHAAIKSVAPQTTIQIKSCDVSNRYDKERKTMYTNYAVFGFDLPEDNRRSSKPKPAQNTTQNFGGYEPSDEAKDDLPF